MNKLRINKDEKNKILYIQAEHIYTIIYLTDGDRRTVRKSLKEWEEELEKDGFIKIDRSHLVNIEYIQEVNRGVRLVDGKHIKIPHGKIKDIKLKYLQHNKKIKFI